MNSRISLFFKGMLMGVAEIIPGVSGGTLAFITGIYNELINSIRSINFESISFLTKLKLRKFWKHVNGNFLLTLVLGMITSIVLFSRIISFLLTNYNFHIWGFFFGLIISSAILISRNINDLSLKNYVFLNITPLHHYVCLLQTKRDYLLIYFHSN